MDTEQSSKYTLDVAFPSIRARLKPLGNRVVLQIRTPIDVTDGGIIIPLEAQDRIEANEMVAKVIELGPVAFKNRDTLTAWPEGDWIKPGDFALIPKYGGARDEVYDKETGKKAIFVIFNDHEIIALVNGSPLATAGEML